MGTIHKVVQDYLTAHPEDKRVVDPFLQGFSATHASRRASGRGEVSIFYLKADGAMAQLLGLEREMLLVYAPYAEFQARTMEIHDDVLASNRGRLDPLGSVIVAGAHNTRSFIDSYLIREPERSAIVALTTDDLGHLDTRDALSQLFLQQLFRRDLFSQESPITRDSMFFGRQELIIELFDRVLNGQNSGLFGLRRMGKTSVLYAVQRRLRTTGEGIFTYVFLGNPSRWKLRWRDLLQFIVREIASECAPDRLETGKIFALRKSYSEEQAADHFRADIRALLDIAPGGRIVLGLDELEHISFDVSPGVHWNEDFLPFWQALRGVHQELHGRFSFMVAGVNPHALEESQLGRSDNPLFETARLYYLPPFREEDVANMVGTIAGHMGIAVEPDVYPRLCGDFGGHPFLTRKACSVVASELRQRPASITLEFYERLHSKVGHEVALIIEQIISVLGAWYPAEYELMRRLAHGDSPALLDAVAERSAVAKHVEGYGLVADARGSPRITIGAVTTYLLGVPGPSAEQARQPTDWEAKILEVSRRRNAIEVELRRVVSEGLRFKFGQKAGDHALKCWPESRRAILQQYSYDDRWQHLDFKELVSVIDNEYDAFQNWFAQDRAQVLTWLDHINRSRADAHAKTLSDEEFAYLRVCFRRLEELLGLPNQ